VKRVVYGTILILWLLAGCITDTKGLRTVSPEEKKRLDLYVTAMKAAFEAGNGGNEFIAVKLETLDGLGKEAKQLALRALEDLSPDVHDFQEIKSDTGKFTYDEQGRLQKARGGTVLYIDVEQYEGNEAVIQAVSWFGNVGAVLPKYKARYVNGRWQLRLITMCVA